MPLLVSAVGLVDDGRRRVLRIVDPATGEAVHTLREGPLKEFWEQECDPSVLAFSRDGLFVAVAAIGFSVRLWNVVSGEVSALLRGHDGQGECVCAGRAYGAHPSNSVCTVEGRHRGTVKCICFCPRGRIATGGEDTSVIVWDARSGQVERSLTPHPGATYDKVDVLAFSQDGSRLACASHMHILVWEVGAWDVVARLESKPNTDVLFFSADGRLVVGDCDQVSGDLEDLSTPGPGFRGMKLFDLVRGSIGDAKKLVDLLSALPEGESWSEPTHVEPSPTGDSFVGCTCDGFTVRSWDASGAVRWRQQGHLPYRRDGCQCYFEDSDDDDTTPSANCPLPGHRDEINSVSMCPDGRFAPEPWTLNPQP